MINFQLICFFTSLAIIKSEDAIHYAKSKDNYHYQALNNNKPVMIRIKGNNNVSSLYKTIPIYSKYTCLVVCAALVFVLYSCHQKALQQFTDISANCGITFANNITESEQQNIFTYEYMYNGGGVAVGDVNNDGLPDIFFTANQLPDRLYINKGNLKFEDVTTFANVAGKSGWKTGVTMADVNGDGLLDIYVCYSGNGDEQSKSNQLFINKGIKNGVPYFEDEAKKYALDAPGTNSNQALFFDYDNDGDLDMFLLNHAVTFYNPLFNTYKLRHKRHPYYSNYLFRNDEGHFTDVSAQAGIPGGGNNFGLGVVAADINNDGWQDLYMTNDYDEQDFLLLNNHNGTFTQITKEAIKHISKSAMGCDVADYNNDGLPDIIVPDMWPEDNYRRKVLRGPDGYDHYNLLVDSGYMRQDMRNTLQLNTGIVKNNIPQFSEIGQLAGVSSTDWSWSSLLADFDDDGYKDLYITNGFWRDYSNLDFQSFTVANYINMHGPNASPYQLLDSIPQTKLSNYLFRNNGNLTFETVTDKWGLHTSNVSNGVAYADLDNDGDLDLIVNNMGERASVYRNNNISKGNYLNIKLQGKDRNTLAVGSQITITTADGKLQTAEQQPVRGYLSSMQPIVHFGLGRGSMVSTLTVRWPTGGFTRLKNVKANQILSINEKTSVNESLNIEPVKTSLFTDVSKKSGINFFQGENEYVDFATEPLLPWQLSKQGPKMCKADVNGDGLEDVFIGAPKGGKACLYMQQHNGSFKLSTSQPWQKSNQSDDIQAVFFDADGDKDLDVYIVKGGNEMPDGPAYQDELYLNDGKGNFTKAISALPVMQTSKSCVAVGDFNDDGKPDLFVGGRLIPGKYGLAPQSYLLENKSSDHNLRFVDVTASVAPSLHYAGMVTSAVFTDINKDGYPDLVITGEWMPVKIYLNQKNKFSDQTNKYGLENSNGLWTCIIPMDIDDDGDEDFLLGNLAPNTQFHASAKQPMTLCVNDFFHTGKTEPIVCYYINDTSYPYASRNEMLSEIALLKNKFPYYKDYARAKLNDIFTPDERKGMIKLRVNELKNCWLENTGNRKFVLHELPVAAQFSAIQGATDVNLNNGIKAIFAAGNFYPFRVQLGREDAGKGIFLTWDKPSHTLVPCNLKMDVDGDVRDVLKINSNNHQQIVISKNNDSVQVIQIVNK